MGSVRIAQCRWEIFTKETKKMLSQLFESCVILILLKVFLWCLSCRTETQTLLLQHHLAFSILENQQWELVEVASDLINNM